MNKLLLALILSVGFANAQAVLLGTASIQSTLDHNPSGKAQAWPASASVSGLLSSISIYVDNSTVKPVTAVVGLYSSRNGRPNKLLTSGSAPFNLPGSGWLQIGVPAVNVTQKSIYFVAILGVGSGTLEFRDDGSGCTSYGSSGTALTALPSSWSTKDTWGSCPVSAYGSGSSTPPPSQYTLNVSTVGQGNLLTSPAASSYAAGTVVTVSESPASGWTFGGWSGACSGLGPCSVTMNSTQAVTGTFTQNIPPPPGHSVTLSWSDDGSAVSYKVYRDGAVIGTATLTTFKDSNVAAGATYSYDVTAVNNGGESTPSNLKQAVIPSP